MLSDAPRPLSTIVGRREREEPGRPSSDADPYILPGFVAVWFRSFMSFRYAITERNARVDASRCFSSSLRETSAGSWAGLGVALRISSTSPLEAMTPCRNGPGAGMLRDGGISMGRKLLRRAARVVGEGARSVLLNEDGAEGLILSTRSRPSATGGEISTAGFAVIAPSVPVVDSRTSMRGDVTGLGDTVGRSAAAGLEVRSTWGALSCMGSYGFMGVERPDDEGESIRILPIDIFFKNPHLPGVFSFCEVLCRSEGLFSAVAGRLKLRPGVEGLVVDRARLISGEEGFLTGFSSSSCSEILSHRDLVRAVLEPLGVFG